MKINRCRDAETSGSLAADSTGCIWHLETLETTHALGRQLAHDLPSGSILLLHGPLGAGKTSLVQGLAEGLGISEPITSPTFALAQHYSNEQGQTVLVHLDLYRLEHPAAADDLFLQEEEDARAMNALMAVEWPERLSINLPEAWRLSLEHKGDERRAELTPPHHDRSR